MGLKRVRGKVAESVEEHVFAGYFSLTLQGNQHSICVLTEPEGCSSILQIASLPMCSNFILFYVEDMNKNFKITLLLNLSKVS